MTWSIVIVKLLLTNRNDIPTEIISVMNTCRRVYVMDIDR